MTDPLFRAAVARRDANTVLRYLEPLARFAAAPYFLPGGGDEDDLVQEARVGIAKAVRDFRGRPDAFIPFARLCAKRQVITAVKKATAGKHGPLNGSSSIDAPHDDDAGSRLADVIPLRGPTVDEQLDQRDQVRAVVRAIETELSPAERRAVIAVAIDGRRYDDVAPGVDRKQIDNALQRARRKLAA